MTHRFPIGTVYATRGKNSQRCTVVDHLTTLNSKGEVVNRRYVASHVFLGQVVEDRDVVEVTIARGLDALPTQVGVSERFYLETAEKQMATYDAGTGHGLTRNRQLAYCWTDARQAAEAKGIFEGALKVALNVVEAGGVSDIRQEGSTGQGVGVTCSPQAVPIRSSKGSAIQENRGHEEEQIH